MIPVYLRDWRMRRRISQQQLAQRSGVRQSALSLMEQGKRADVRLSTLERLAQALQVEPQALLSPPPAAVSLSREARQAIAQAIVHDAPLPSAQYAPLAKDIANVISCKLRAFGAPGVRRVKGQRWRVARRLADVRAKYGASLVREVLNGVEVELLGLARDARDAA